MCNSEQWRLVDIFGVRRLDAAFFLSALGKGKRKKAASSRRTPKVDP